MQPDFSHFGPFLFSALIVLLIYRRFRRNFGRQPLRPLRMGFRMLLLAAVACATVPVALHSTGFLPAMLGGVLLGVALALYGARRTRFLTYRDRLYYVPHTYTGIVVSLLFLGRLAYRLVQLYVGAPAAPSRGAGAADTLRAFAPESMVRSPLTVGLLFVLIGYYVCYYGLLLYKSKHIEPDDMEILPPGSAPRSAAVQ